MTTKRSYECNICRKKSGDGKELHGVRFVSGGILLEIAIQAENHICYECLSFLVDAYDKQRCDKLPDGYSDQN